MATPEITTPAQATYAAKRGTDVFEVRRGIRRFGFFTDYDAATEAAEANNARVYDWATGEQV